MKDEKLKYVYFIGIGGIGMSAIARWYKFRGFEVSGYDRTPSDLTAALQAEGIDVHYEDDCTKVPADIASTLVIYTPAVPAEFGELQFVQQKGYKVERQKFLPIFWDDVKLDQDYRMDLVVNDNIIIELKAISHIDTPHRRQLWNYMNLTHLPYGMLINFSPDGLYSEWYKRDNLLGNIDRIKLL